MIWQEDRQSLGTTTGLLRIKPLSPNNHPITVTRDNWPPTTDLEDDHGPHLFEQTDYVVSLTSKDGGRVALTHRDPQLLQAISPKPDGTDLVSIINYRSQVGYSDFTILLDGVPEFTFTVEVFPTKLEYRQDFEEMLAEVQEILTGLALEYLKSTYNLGSSRPHPDTTGLEWLILLKSVAARPGAGIAAGGASSRARASQGTDYVPCRANPPG